MTGRVKEVKYIDITPKGMETPQGQRRVNKAYEANSDAAKALAAAATTFLIQHNMALIAMVAKEAKEDLSIGDNWRNLQSLLKDYRRTQEELVRAVAGAPPQPEIEHHGV